MRRNKPNVKAAVTTKREQPSEASGQAQVRQEVQQLFSGPIPPPNVLENYERVLPGSADRIIKMAESEVRHRQEFEKINLTATIRETKIGQILGFLIGVTTIVAGTISAINGAEIAGTVIGSSGVAGLVSVFILGRKQSKS